eukprot:6906807-Prymnesium_polylepis.1
MSGRQVAPKCRVDLICQPCAWERRGTVSPPGRTEAAARTPGAVADRKRNVATAAHGDEERPVRSLRRAQHAGRDCGVTQSTADMRLHNHGIARTRAT